MSNFADFLKALNIEVESNKNSYVYYTVEDGKIHKVSNQKDTNSEYPVLEVPHADVEDIINGIKGSDAFKVQYDVSLKQLSLKEITYEESLGSIDSKLYALPVNRAIVLDSGKKTNVFEDIYDGVEVLIWIPGTKYPKGTLLWENNSVYKLLEETSGADTFKELKTERFIKNVLITDVKSSNRSIEYKTKFQPIFEGVHVDVWYTELPHVAGQHVWINNCVYRLEEDIAANNNFDPSKAELIENNVLMYSDENKYLSFVSRVSPGDKLLLNNRLYLFVDDATQIKEYDRSVTFYVSLHETLHYDEFTGQFSVQYTTEIDGDTEIKEYVIDYPIKITSYRQLKKGTQVLIGKKLYLFNKSSVKSSDITVIQNNISGCWEIELSQQARQGLERSMYVGSDVLYFSITSKYDPNIVYRTIEFSVSDILIKAIQKYPYQFKWEYEQEDVSVYTSKFFESYKHEVLG